MTEIVRKPERKALATHAHSTAGQSQCEVGVNVRDYWTQPSLWEHDKTAASQRLDRHMCFYEPFILCILTCSKCLHTRSPITVVHCFCLSAAALLPSAIVKVRGSSLLIVPAVPTDREYRSLY